MASADNPSVLKSVRSTVSSRKRGAERRLSGILNGLKGIKRRLFADIPPEDSKKNIEFYANLFGEAIVSPEYAYDVRSKYTRQHILKVVTKYVKRCNSALSQSDKAARLRITGGPIILDEVSPASGEHPLFHTFSFSISLIKKSASQSGSMKPVSVVKCVVCHLYKPSNANEYIRAFIENSKDPIGLFEGRDFIGVGFLDSNIDIDFEPIESSGYNRTLRTCAYTMMHEGFECKFLASNAHSTKSAHILMKYFGFIPNPRDVKPMLIKEFKGTNDRRVKLLLKRDVESINKLKPEDIKRNTALMHAIHNTLRIYANLILEFHS